MIVCASPSLVCTDLRLGSQAYSGTAGVPVPGFVAFGLTATDVPASQFSSAIEAGVESTVATSLNGLTLSRITSSDVLVTAVSFKAIMGLAS